MPDRHRRIGQWCITTTPADPFPGVIRGGRATDWPWWQVTIPRIRTIRVGRSRPRTRRPHRA